MSIRKGNRFMDGELGPENLKVDMATEVISQYLGHHTAFLEPPGSEAWLAAEGFVSVPRRLLIHVLSTGTVALHDAVGDLELGDTLDQLIREFAVAIGELLYRAGIEPESLTSWRDVADGGEVPS